MPISLCIVGAPGLIGKRWTQHAFDEPLVDLTCIVDPTDFGVHFAQERNLTLYKSVDEMLAARQEGKVKVDSALLATPNATHVPLGVQLVEAGIHTLVEKPFSTDVESGRRLVAAERGSSARLLVGQHRRFNPYIVNVKALLDSGKLGKVLAVQGVWATLKPADYFEGSTAWRKVAGTGGVVLINLVHDVDLLRHMLGDIVRVYCEKGVSTRGHEAEETGAVVLKFASGAVGTFVFSDATASPYNFEAATGENPLMPQESQPIYTVFGTSGSFSFPELKLFHYNTPSESWTDKISQDPAASVDSTPPFTRQLRHFVDVVEGKAEPSCGGLDGLKSIITLEAILESMKTGLPVDVAQG
ncbi:hypothetical protein JCM8547_002071 [Rhodosporidiobolus lusitaniae]